MIDYKKLNREIFNHQYDRVDLSGLIEKVRKGEQFFSEAVKVHTS